MTHEARVLSQAVCRAAKQLDISDELLADVLGIAPFSVTGLSAGTYILNTTLQEWTSALLFVRLYIALDSITGDERIARKWLKSPNEGLNGKPMHLILSNEGLLRVVQYLEARSAVI